MKIFKITVAILLVVIFLAACGLSPETTVATPLDFNIQLEQAEDAYLTGDFELAYEISQEILHADPTNTTAWDLNRKAAIAHSGDEYLRWLPTDRYRISPETFLYEQVNGRQFFILDIREPDEFNAGHIENAVNIPLRELLDNLDQLPDKSVPILIYCRSMKRSTHALVLLRELGYVQSYNLDGGFIAFQEYISTNPDVFPGPIPTLPPVSTEGC